MEQKLLTKVWQMGGLLSAPTPGLLILSDGHISFVTGDGEKFSVPVSDVKDVKWPFLQFGLGFNSTVNNTQYKFTFMKPNGAAEIDNSAMEGLTAFSRIGRGIDAIATLSKWGSNKEAAKQWKAVFEAN